MAAFTLADLIQKHVGFHFEPRIAQAGESSYCEALNMLSPDEAQRIQTQVQQSGRFVWHAIVIELPAIIPPAYIS